MRAAKGKYEWLAAGVVLLGFLAIVGACVAVGVNENLLLGSAGVVGVGGNLLRQSLAARLRGTRHERGNAD